MYHRTETNSHKQTVISTANQLVNRNPPPAPRNRSGRRKLHGGLTASQASTYKGMKRAIASCDGECDWSVDRLAAYCGIGRTTFQENRRVIVDELCLIELTERPGTQHRHATNLWRMPQLGGGGRVRFSAPVLKLLNTIKKTNTRAADRPGEKGVSVSPKPETQTRPGPAYSRREENHPAKHRERVEHNARWKARQEEKARERCRMASEARVGVYDPHKNDVNEPQSDAQVEKWVEECRTRQKERQAQAEAQIAAANEQRRREHAERERRNRAEAAEPPSAEEKATVDRIKKLLDAVPKTPTHQEIVFQPDYRELEHERQRRAEAIAKAAAAEELRQATVKQQLESPTLVNFIRRLWRGEP
jgi:hypothetical protein